LAALLPPDNVTAAKEEARKFVRGNGRGTGEQFIIQKRSGAELNGLA
jgi:hypothetical protein